MDLAVSDLSSVQECYLCVFPSSGKTANPRHDVAGDAK
jgi:hypothetical protein